MNSMPSVTHSMSSVTHSMPFVTHSMPFVTHSMPFVTNSMPFVTHSMPFVTNSMTIYYFESDERDTTIQPPVDDWKFEADESCFGRVLKEIARS